MSELRSCEICQHRGCKISAILSGYSGELEITKPILREQGQMCNLFVFDSRKFFKIATMVKLRGIKCHEILCLDTMIPHSPLVVMAGQCSCGRYFYKEVKNA